MIQGHATPKGTITFSKKYQPNSKNYCVFEELTLSNVGVGTYLGNPDNQTDELVKNAVKKSVESGVNVIDTAINYRAQKAERSVGKAISELINEKKINRNEVFICTKNGYVTNDGDVNSDFWTYVKNEYVQKEVIKDGDISSGYHCMTIPYLTDQLNRSLKNLNIDCVDLMYLHNAVEGQINDVTREQFLKNLKDVFEFYETKRKEGLIQFYGMATWECFRVPQNNPQYFSLLEILQLAKEAGGTEHGFRFIQLPYNMYLDQAYMLKNQPDNGNAVSILESAKNNHIGVFTSVPFMQGKLLSPGVMPEFSNLKPSLRALQFIRSTPGVLAPLAGQKSDSHVQENLSIMNIPPLSESEFVDLLKKLTS
jgi:aryl-alcohol dehydrogenase-like predicted oxidoreductase